MIPDFSQRSSQLEIMDDLLCEGEVVHQTLRELELINRWLGGNTVTLDGVEKLMRDNKETPITIADLGCGGGDMLMLLADKARKKNRKVRLIGMDANPHIIAFARNHCSAYPEIEFETINIQSPEFRGRKFDIILGTLFYHHFSNDALIDFFANAKAQATRGLVINDIHRHWLAFQAIRLLTQLFSRSAMVKFDAPLSVLRAFSRNELGLILSQAGISQFKIKWKWAFRWQVIVHS